MSGGETLLISMVVRLQLNGVTKNSRRILCRLGVQIEESYLPEARRLFLKSCLKTAHQQNRFFPVAVAEQRSGKNPDEVRKDPITNRLGSFVEGLLKLFD